MPPHIDKYKVHPNQDKAIFLERIDGQDAINLEASREQTGFPLPNFGDFVILTKVHEDGECNQQFEGNKVTLHETPLPDSTQDLGTPTAA